jgi:transaldolase
MELIEQVVAIYASYDFDTEVLVASVRHPLHVVQAALLGADVATLPFDTLKKLYGHPLTDAGLDRFLSDWRNTGRDFHEE